MWQIIGWIIWAFVAFQAIIFVLGVRRTMKSGRHFMMATGIQTFFLWIIAILFLVFKWNKLHMLWITPVAFFSANFFVLSKIPILSPIVKDFTTLFLSLALIGIKKPKDK